jgi:hypothetical protein
MKIIYRISDAGYAKVKPDYINNENCLKNFCNVFYDHIYDIHVIADNCSDDTIAMIKKYIDPAMIEKTSIGSGAGSFNYALDKALRWDDDEIVYFVENDYLHLKRSPAIIKDMLEMGASYATLYLHPDKFMSPQYGGNPEVDVDGGYLTKIYRGKTELYAMFNSTTMTFAATVGTLRDDESILREYTTGTYPRDFEMFLALRAKGQALFCPLNAYSTHGETAWLAPLYKTTKENLLEEWRTHL